MAYKLTIARLWLLEKQLNDRLQLIAKKYMSKHPLLVLKIPKIKLGVQK